MGATARVPVYMRIGNANEHVIGSLAVVPVEAGQLPASGPVRVRIDGGTLATAALLEAVAAELRRNDTAEGEGGA